MVVLGLVVLDLQRAGLSRAEKELEAAVVDEAASSVIAALDQTSDVAARVSLVFADDAIDSGARARMIGDIVSRAPAASGVAFFDEQHQFVDAVLPKGKLDDARRIPPEGHGFRVVALPEGPRAPRYEAPLQGSVRGFVVVGLAREVLGSRLREISLLRFGAPDRVVLVDESLQVLGGGTQRPLSIFAASGSSTKSFATELLLTTEFKDGAVDKVGTIRTLPAQRWALVVERPTDEAFGALATARRAFLLSVSGLAALAVLASLLLVRQVLGPIGALMRLVQRYGRRDFTARSGVRSGDELEALGSSLEHMADDLALSEKEIEKRARIETNLRRYMSEEAAEAAAQGDHALPLGGAKERVTVVFADVVVVHRVRGEGKPNDPLFRGNRVSTQAASAADVTFRDETQVRLGERTLVIILGDARSAAAKVSATAPAQTTLVTGNLRAFMAGARKDASAAVATDAASVKIYDGEAQVSADGVKTTRLAVYGGSSTIDARGTTREVARGFGSKAELGRQPTLPRPLPPAPTWSTSPPLVLLDGGAASIAGAYEVPPKPDPKIAEWRIQIARDGIFRDVAVDTRVPGTVRRMEAQPPGAGRYYIRVSAIDDDQFEGPFSRIARVLVIKATTTLLPQARRRLEVEPPDAFCVRVGNVPLWRVEGPILAGVSEPVRLRCAPSESDPTTLIFLD